MNGNQYSYRPLFGHVFLTIQKFLSTFRSARYNDNNEPTPVIVIMGTPQAAFRKITSVQSNITPDNPAAINSQVNLPLINFVAVDFRRVFGQENPYARVSTGKTRIDSNGREFIQVDTSPQSWVIMFQMALWTDGYKQRDDLMSRILTTFRHEVGLKWYPDEIEQPGDFIWIELKMEDTFQDDTNLEELSERESRKLVRTSFTVTCQTILPYDTEEVPLIKSIQISEKAAALKGEHLRYDVEIIDGEEIVTLNKNNFFPVVFPSQP